MDSWSALAMANDSTVFRYWDSEKIDDGIENGNAIKREEDMEKNDDNGDDVDYSFGEVSKNYIKDEENSVSQEISWGALASANEDSVFKYWNVDTSENDQDCKDSRLSRRQRISQDKDRSRSRLRVVYTQSLAQEICRNPDTADARIVIRNVDVSMDKAIIDEHFSKYGKLLAILRTERSLIVQFEEAVDAQACLREGTTTRIGDDTAELSLATRLREKEKRDKMIYNQHHSLDVCRKADTIDSRICIKIINLQIDKSIIADYFSKFGRVLGIFRGDACIYVQFEHAEDAKAALLAGTTIKLGPHEAELMPSKKKDRIGKHREEIIMENFEAYHICNDPDTVDARICVRLDDEDVDKNKVKTYFQRFGKIHAILKSGKVFCVQFVEETSAFECLDSQKVFKIGKHRAVMNFPKGATKYLNGQTNKSGAVLLQMLAKSICLNPSTQDSRICVKPGGIIGKEAMLHYFSKYGQVVAIYRKLPLFTVQFENVDSVQACLEDESEVIIDNVDAVVEPDSNQVIDSIKSSSSAVVDAYFRDNSLIDARVRVTPVVEAVTKRTIKGKLNRYGKILGVKICKYKQVEKGVLERNDPAFAYVQFEEVNSAAACIQKGTFNFSGTEVTIDPARGSNRYGNEDANSQFESNNTRENTTKKIMTDERLDKLFKDERTANARVRLKNIHPDITEAQIKVRFSPFGKVLAVRLHKGVEKKGVLNNFNFGFVQFDDPKDAAVSVTLGKVDIKGCVIKIDPVKRFDSDGEANMSRSSDKYGNPNMIRVPDRYGNSKMSRSSDSYGNPNMIPVPDSYGNSNMSRSSDSYGNPKKKRPSYGYRDSSMNRPQYESRNFKDNYSRSFGIDTRQSNTDILPMKSPAVSSGKSPGMSPLSDPSLMNARVYVGNIQGTLINEFDLQNLFSNFGVVLEVKMFPIDNYISYALVQFHNKEGAQNCLFVGDHIIIKGQQLDVKPLGQ